MLAFTLIVIFFAILGSGAMIAIRYLKESLNSDDDKEKYIPTVQDNLPIDYIRRGVVKLKTGSYAMVIQLPTINTDLMEEGERESVFLRYRQVLSALNFPSFQYLEQSRVVDVDDYIRMLEKIKQTTENKYIRIQLEYYKNFIERLVSTRAILTRKFYLVLSFDKFKQQKMIDKKGNMFDVTIGQKKNKKKNAEKQERETDVLEEERKFEAAYKQLKSMADVAIQSFSRFEGETPRILNDEELCELLYTSYNKERSVYQPLRVNDIQKRGYLSLYVRKGE